MGLVVILTIIAAEDSLDLGIVMSTKVLLGIIMSTEVLLGIMMPTEILH